jgi:hypothetical protein
MRAGLRSRTRVAVALGLSLAASVLVPVIASGGVSTCRTSGPGTGPTVEVCVGEPGVGETVTGAVPVTVLVTVSNGADIEGVRAFLGGEIVLLDEDAPYRFVIPSDRYADGSYELGISALVDLGGGFTTPRTRVPLTFDNGNAGDPGPAVTFEPPDVPDTGDPVVLAAVGDGAGSDTGAPAVLSLIESWNPDVFLYLGDVYREGTHAEFASWYGPPGKNFAVLAERTAPTPGNHEYLTDAGEPYFEYWGVGHSYAFDAGPWRVISLDANKAYHGYDVGSPQYTWLEDELTTNRRDCTLVFWHQPRFTVGKYSPGADWMQPVWELLAREGVDVTVHGHDHGYQRWKPLGPTGSASADGVRQFITGTGGHPTYSFQRSDSRMATGLEHTHGALRFELRASGADWSWQRTTGEAVDAGSLACSPAPDRQAPTAPAGLRATAIGPREVALDWDRSTDDVGVSGYRIFRDGIEIDQTPSLPTDATDPTVEPDTRYAYRVRAFDAAGNLSASSDRVTVTTPPDDHPPSPPGPAQVVDVDRFHVRLTWDPATDDVGVDRYEVLRDGAQVGTAATTSFVDDAVEPGVVHRYRLRAVDTAGQRSVLGTPADVTIPGAAFADGFESGTLSAWTASQGGVIDEGAGVRGTRAVRFDVHGTGRGYAFRTLAAPIPDALTELRFELDTRADNVVEILSLRSQSGSGLATLLVDRAGHLAVREEPTGIVTASRKVVDDGAPHVLRVRAIVDGSRRALLVRLDGGKVGALSGDRQLGAAALGRVRIGDGTQGRRYDLVIDEVAVWRP